LIVLSPWKILLRFFGYVDRSPGVGAIVSGQCGRAQKYSEIYRQSFPPSNNTLSVLSGKFELAYFHRPFAKFNGFGILSASSL
jgi:hypothetical protein